jgi:hypothetical protein
MIQTVAAGDSDEGQPMTPDEIQKQFRESEQLREQIGRGSVGLYTVALFAVFGSHNDERLELAGTGTLVSPGMPGILTAAHVWEKLLKLATKIGLSIQENIDHSFFIDPKTVVPTLLPVPKEWNEWGADLVFLRIPKEHLGTIKAYRSFYEPAVDGKRTAPKEVTEGVEIFMLTGCPKEKGQFNKRHADVVINTMFVNPSEPKDRNGLDFIDVDIETKMAGIEKFGGVSGGGLWKAFIYWDPETQRIDSIVVLRGVAFYELPLQNGHREIRCHGPNSINSLLAKVVH